MITSHGYLRLAVIAAGFVAGAVPLILAINSPGGPHRAVIAAIGPVIGWAFIGTGLYAWARRPANRVGPLMIAVGFSFCVASLSVAQHPWLHAIGLLFLPLPYAILTHILLAFPTGELTSRAERVIVGLSYLSATVGHWSAVMFQNTIRQGAPHNPLLIADDLTVVVTLYRLRFTVGVILLVALAVILIRRWREASLSQRRALAPVFISGGLAMGLMGLWYLTSLARLPDSVVDLLWEIRVVALAVVPFAFLGGLLRSRVAQGGAVSRLVAQLGDENSRRGRLRELLAEALGDPTLTLAYWLPERGEYVDSDGRRVQLPDVESGRVSTIVDRHGEPIAALIHDGSLAEERELITAVGAAASLALENERLDAQLYAKLEELQQSRARIVESSDATRRRIERDLHDGAQQRLVSLALTLRVARARLQEDPDDAKQLLESASRELELALAELRELARGIHPAVLSERGLGAALDGVAERASIPVELVDTPNDRLPPPLEAAAYFVVAEAVTNVAKYAQASHATVSVQRNNGVVEVQVADDGIGGADPAKGTGLRGLADRVSALNGRLEVISEHGHGTTVKATIPCR
ncbi:MAG TPA: sensor histidine kinase [Propionibacteriaceae bacterium]|nr:sensor histidine kinase [Propionibacteriaceae bacterium]